MMSESHKGTRHNYLWLSNARQSGPGINANSFLPIVGCAIQSFWGSTSSPGQALRGRRTPVFLPLHAYPGHQS